MDALILGHFSTTLSTQILWASPSFEQDGQFLVKYSTLSLFPPGPHAAPPPAQVVVVHSACCRHSGSERAPDSSSTGGGGRRSSREEAKAKRKSSRAKKVRSHSNRHLQRTFVKCLAGWWAVRVAATLPS